MVKRRRDPLNPGMSTKEKKKRKESNLSPIECGSGGGLTTNEEAGYLYGGGTYRQ